MIKRLLVFILALALLPLGFAHAGGMAFPVQAGKFPPGETLAADIRVQVKAWPDIAEETLAALQSWLAAARLSVRLERQGAMSLASLYDSRGEVLAAQTETFDGEARLTLRAGDGLTPIRYLGSAENPPWQALFGGLPALPNTALAAETLSEIGQAALVPLLPFEKPVKRSITIKNAGRGASQKTYTLKKAEAQAFWEGAAPQLLPLLERLVLSLAPGQAGAASALRDMQMAGPLTIKRFLREDGSDLGLQVTASLRFGAQTRRLTLYGGISESGLYLSFKLPAARGGDTLELQLSAAFRGDRLSGDWKARLVSGKRTSRTAGEFDLNCTPDDEGLAFEGSLEFDYILSGDVKKSLSYTLVPALRFSGDSLTGTLDIKEYTGRKLLRDVLLTFSQPSEVLAPLQAQAEADLLAASPDELALAKARVSGALLPALKRFLLSLDAQTMPLVLHDLGRVRRTQGESVQPLPDNDGLFTVTDQVPDEATKEDTP